MLNLIVAPYDVAENAEKYCKRIVAYLKEQKIEYAVYFHEKLEQVATSVANALALNESEFVIVGNDAVVSVFVNAVKDLSKIKFGIVPVGVMDDFAKFLGMPTNPISAIKVILQKNVDCVDYLLVNDIKCVNNLLVGASAEVFEKYMAGKVKNFITQNLAISQYGTKFEGVELTLNFKGNKDRTENIFELSIANGGLANGKKVSPLSNVKDGLFNLNFVALPEKNERKKYLSLFKTGEQIYKESTNQFWLENVKISQPDNKIKAILDGRIFNLEEINVSVVASGLKIFSVQE